MALALTGRQLAPSGASGAGGSPEGREAPTPPHPEPRFCAFHPRAGRPSNPSPGGNYAPQSLPGLCFQGRKPKAGKWGPCPGHQAPGQRGRVTWPPDSRRPPLRDPWGSCLQTGLLDTGATPHGPCPCSHGHTGSPAAHASRVAGQLPPGCSVSSRCVPRPTPAVHVKRIIDK